MSEEQKDLAALDDVAFLAERRKVRDQIERMPDGERPEELLRRYEAIDAEFLRRAGLAWALASKGI
jgi:hypothetical protein